MYVDAFKIKDTVHVIERVDGIRVYKQYDARYLAYYQHASGAYQSIFGDILKKFETNDFNKFKKKLAELSAGNKPKRLFESDINPVYRCLEDNYTGCETPELHIAFYDIETNFDVKKGFAPVYDPFNYITAITVHLKWIDKLVTLAISPPTLSLDEARDLIQTENTYIFDDEWEMLDVFLGLIEDADVLCGYNSTFFDLPYIVNRLSYIGKSAEMKRLCLLNQRPRARDTIHFGKEVEVYDLYGRCSLDWLELFRKHTPQQQSSYKLDHIGGIIIGEHKVPYEGSLDDLYKKDFVKFIDYSRQDVAMLAKMEEEKRYITLSNQVAHSNLVLLKNTLGTVVTVETAVTNAIHSLLKRIVPNKKPRDIDFPQDEDGEIEEPPPVVGAYVTPPVTGVHEHVGACDITSLYPSVLRSFNASIETVVGHIRPILTDALIEQRIASGIDRAEAWDGVFNTIEFDQIVNKESALVTVDMEDGEVVIKTGAQWYDHIFNPANKLTVTANGTIFSLAQEGIFSVLLTNWFNERKELQAHEKKWKKEADSANCPERKAECLKWAGFYNARQQAKKINLNSFYGAILNRHCKYYDERIGKSTTLTGRSIIRHTAATVNLEICGKYDHIGESIFYGDTDSVFFSAYEFLKDNPDHKNLDWSRENIVKLYEEIIDKVNLSFPGYMQSRFNVPSDRGHIVKTGLDLVASNSLFIKKKKYACLCYFYEGQRVDENGELGYTKIMGLDIKRSDSPLIVQRFLSKLLRGILTGVSKIDLYDNVKSFRSEFKGRPGWEKGSPMRANSLSTHTKSLDQMPKLTSARSDKERVLIPGHTRAAINWNILRDMHEDKHSMKIDDGDKVIVCKLLPNVMKMESVAYPIDEPHIPQWFKDLPFDNAAMETTIIDKKIMNLVSVLDWDLNATKVSSSDEFFIF